MGKPRTWGVTKLGNELSDRLILQVPWDMAGNWYLLYVWPGTTPKESDTQGMCWIMWSSYAFPCKYGTCLQLSSVVPPRPMTLVPSQSSPTSRDPTKLHPITQLVWTQSTIFRHHFIPLNWLVGKIPCLELNLHFSCDHLVIPWQIIMLIQFWWVNHL